MLTSTVPYAPPTGKHTPKRHAPPELILFVTVDNVRVVNPGLSERDARANDELARRVRPGIKAIEAALRAVAR